MENFNMKKITIFTANLWNDGRLETPLHKFCIDTWQRAKSNIESQGYECEIKIFSYDDELVKEYFDEIGLHKNSKYKAVVSDGFKMFILSKFPNYLWLDWDIFINKNYKFNDEFYLNGGMYYIYNSDNTEFFKNIYSKYKTGEFVDMIDFDVFKKLGIKKTKFIYYNQIKHLYGIDNYNKIVFTDDVDLINKLSKIGEICIMTHNTDISSEDYPRIIRYKDEDIEIINFIKELGKMHEKVIIWK